MALSLDMTRRYTYADYLTWTDNKRRELIDGFIRLFMSPAPITRHQRFVWKLNNELSEYLVKHKAKCEVYFAPFDVRFPKENAPEEIIAKAKKKGAKYNSEIYTVVQPDICVICNPEQIDDYGCIGPPNFICEVTSSSRKANKYDRTTKFALYERNKVPEYWILDPLALTLDCYYLGGEDGSTYELVGHYDYNETPNATAQVKGLQNHKIKIKNLFGE
jgi:Uma2 family endonuclease